VLSLAQNLFGLAAGPLLAGFLSDAYGLPFALSVIPGFCLLAAAFFLFAARTYVSDLQRANGEGVPMDNTLAPQPA
jgi:MFS family permease